MSVGSQVDHFANDIAARASAAGRDALHDAARELLAAGNHLRWSDEHGELELRTNIDQKQAAGLACVQLEHGPTRLRLTLEHERPGGTHADDASWRDYRDDARLLAWTLEHEELVETLGQVFANPVQATGFVPHGDHDCLWLALQYHDPHGGTAEGWIGLGPAEARHLATVAAWQRDPERPAVLGETMSLPMTLWIPGMALSNEDIEQAGPGDVLIMASHDQDMFAQLRPDREATREIFGLPEAWTARYRDGQWKLVGPAVLERANEPDRPYFLLTSFSMPLEKAAALQPGTTLACASPLAGSTVGIALGGKRFGEGTLVMLGKIPGVRIDHREDPHGS